MQGGQLTTVPGSEQAGGLEVVRFARALAASASFEELERRFVAGFGPLLGISMYGYDLIDPVTETPSRLATANVSETFVASYYRDAREVDPLVEKSLETGRAVYNLDQMSPEEWEGSAVYRRAYRLHRMRHVVEIPVLSAGRIAGHLHFAASEPDHDFGPDTIALATELTGLLGHIIEGLELRDRVERHRDQARAALALTGTPVATSDHGSTRLQLNGAARRLLADIADSEEHLHRLLARPPGSTGGYSRRAEVELVTGERATLHGHVAPVRRENGGLVAVLELEREQPAFQPVALAPLTPRERDVAALVVDGLADREIADRLCLSHHTVSQYVKRIYRKLEVDSRVALTRVLLAPGPAVRRT